MGQTHCLGIKGEEAIGLGEVQGDGFHTLIILYGITVRNYYRRNVFALRFAFHLEGDFRI